MKLYRLLPPVKKGEGLSEVWFNKKTEATQAYNSAVREAESNPTAFDDVTVTLEFVTSKFTPAQVVPEILNGRDWILDVSVMHTHTVVRW